MYFVGLCGNQGIVWLQPLFHWWKTVPKKTAAEIGCGFFDSLDLQSLNDYKLIFLV